MRSAKFWLGILVLLLGGLGVAARAAETAAAGERLFIIDDDIGMDKQAVLREGPYHMRWAPITDPDGGLELIYALREPRIRVLGVTCAMGCSSTDVCVTATRRILALAGRTDVPVLTGAASPDELGKPTEAARFIVETARAYPGQVEIVATAPLTNIATALMIEPCLPEMWKALHVGTGEFLGALGPVSDGAAFRHVGYKDMNLNVDPESARYLLEHGGYFHVYPNEIMDDAQLSIADWRALRRSHSELARFVAAEIKPFTLFSVTLGRLGGMRGLTLHGVIPLAVAIDPELADPPLERGFSLAYRRAGGHYFKLDDEAPPRPIHARLADAETVERTLMERLTR